VSDYSWVTGEMFDQAVLDIAQKEGVGELLRIPGVWELVSEHLNNAALGLLESQREAG
jgi:hypothetical protein